MSSTMLTGEGGSGLVDDEERVLWDFITPGRVVTRYGLGIEPNIVIDQHFVTRQRNNRLVSVMSTESVPEKYGLGIDEDVAVCITDGRHMEVLGSEGKVAVLFERIDNSRTKFVTSFLRASPLLTGPIINIEY